MILHFSALRMFDKKQAFAVQKTLHCVMQGCNGKFLKYVIIVH